MVEPVYLRRKQAAEYLHTKYGFGSKATLAKKACIRGDGPIYRRTQDGACLYKPEDLDEWAQSRIGDPRRSTRDIA